jgi:hypothetical protein
MSNPAASSDQAPMSAPENEFKLHVEPTFSFREEPEEDPEEEQEESPEGDQPEEKQEEASPAEGMIKIGEKEYQADALASLAEAQEALLEDPQAKGFLEQGATIKDLASLGASNAAMIAEAQKDPASAEALAGWALAIFLRHSVEDSGEDEEAEAEASEKAIDALYALKNPGALSGQAKVAYAGARAAVLALRDEAQKGMALAQQVKDLTMELERTKTAPQVLKVLRESMPDAQIEAVELLDVMAKLGLDDPVKAYKAWAAINGKPEGRPPQTESQRPKRQAPTQPTQTSGRTFDPKGMTADQIFWAKQRGMVPVK